MLLGEKAGQAAQDYIGPITRGDDQAALLQVLQKPRHLHGSHLVGEDLLVELLPFAVQYLGAQCLRNGGDRGSSECRVLGDFRRPLRFELRRDRRYLAWGYAVQDRRSQGAAEASEGLVSGAKEVDGFPRLLLAGVCHQ